MSKILLAEQSLPVELRLETRLCAWGYQVTSLPLSDLLDSVKKHPYDMILCSVYPTDEATNVFFQQLRRFTDVPLLNILNKEQNVWSTENNEIFDAVIDTQSDEESIKELLSNQLREAYRKCHNVRLYQYKGLKLSNGALKTAEMNQHILDLTVKEYMILSLFLCHRECIYTKSTLYEAVWRQPYQGDDNAIKIHISNLRNKLKKANPNETYIETVRGLGYRLCKK